MVEIISDKAEIFECIQETVKILEEHGAVFHQSLKLVSEKGDLRIEMAQPVENQHAILMPEDLLLPIDSFNLKIEKNNFTYTDMDASVTKIQARLMDLQLKLYNLTNKAEHFKKTTHLNLLNKTPELREHLLAGRNGKITQSLIEKSALKPDDNFFCDAFLKSRVLSFKTTANRTPVMVLMPIVDFANHNVLSPSFLNIDHGDKNAIAIMASCPVKGSNESFVSYGPYDALDTSIVYGFSDHSATFSRSVRAEIDIEEFGKIIIHARSTDMKFDSLPAHMQDLKFFIPHILSNVNGKMEISHLYIPGSRAPRALRRVLNYLIQNLLKGRNPSQYQKWVQDAEEEIIKVNINYYNKLKTMLDKIDEDSEALAMFYDMAEFQLKKLEEYKDNAARLAA
jgi:hypothetical protein